MSVKNATFSRLRCPEARGRSGVPTNAILLTAVVVPTNISYPCIKENRVTKICSFASSRRCKEPESIVLTVSICLDEYIPFLHVRLPVKILIP